MTNSSAVFKSLENCTNLTSLNFWGIGNSKDIIDLNLTGLTNLSSISNSNNNFYANTLLPASCEYVSLGHAKKTDFSNLQHIERYWPGGSSRQTVIDSLSTISDGVVLDLFYTRVISSLAQDTDFSIFKDVYDIRGSKLKIKSISVQNRSEHNYNLISLDGFNYIEGLESFVDTGGNMPNLSDISALENFSTTLTNLQIPNCSVSDVSFITGLTRLNFLDLTNCCLAEYVEISTTNDDGTITVTKWFTLKEICDQMIANAGTGTVTLKLKGNTSITSWSYYTDNAKYWTGDSTYGS